MITVTVEEGVIVLFLLFVHTGAVKDPRNYNRSCDAFASRVRGSGLIFCRAAMGDSEWTDTNPTHVMAKYLLGPEFAGMVRTADMMASINQVDSAHSKHTPRCCQQSCRTCRPTHVAIPSLHIHLERI